MRHRREHLADGQLYGIAPAGPGAPWLPQCLCLQSPSRTWGPAACFLRTISAPAPFSGKPSPRARTPWSSPPGPAQLSFQPSQQTAAFRSSAVRWCARVWCGAWCLVFSCLAWGALPEGCWPGHPHDDCSVGPGSCPSVLAAIAKCDRLGGLFTASAQRLRVRDQPPAWGLPGVWGCRQPPTCWGGQARFQRLFEGHFLPRRRLPLGSSSLPKASPPDSLPLGWRFHLRSWPGGAGVQACSL